MSNFIANVNENGSIVESPIGPLEWVTITGQGKLNKLAKKYQYTATVVLDAEVAQPFIDEIDEFFKTHRVKKFAKKAPQSLGYRDHKVATGEKDADTGETIYEETGKIAFTFKTDTTFKDGNPKKIKVFNAKGAEVDLGARMIGNDSRGRLKGVIRYYETEVEHGVSLYLNAVQLSKFVPYVGGVQMDEVVDDDGDGFEGFEDESTPLPAEEQAASANDSKPARGKGKDKPRL
jgi:hypothetical protein